MRDASGRPATTAATAFVDALTLLGAEAIAIPALWSKIMDKFMEANGFAVHSEVAGSVASIELGRVNPKMAYDLARRTDRPNADVIIMPGGNWASMPVVGRLENELGKPIPVNNAASLWAGLRLLKRSCSIHGYGQLLRDHLAA
jgi:maleate cis-trans isomerase